jgi:hypothetical protein
MGRFIGAGIALILHGFIAMIGSLMTSSSRENPQQNDAK